jgi:hypothetical protein
MSTRRLGLHGLLVALLVVAMAPARANADGKIGKDCTYKGFKLHGKVKIVDAFPDLKVQIVKVFPDLRVEQVKVFPSKCGQWQMVEVFPDLKIQIVDAFPDLKIEYVTAFPGLP